MTDQPVRIRFCRDGAWPKDTEVVVTDAAMAIALYGRDIAIIASEDGTPYEPPVKPEKPATPPKAPKDTRDDRG